MALSPKMKRVISIIAIASVMVIVIVLVPVIIATSSDTTNVEKVTPEPPKKPEKLPFDLSKLSDEEKSRINCFLEGESRFETLTRYQCEEVRGCIYNESKYQSVPDCYFNRTWLGYSMAREVSPTEIHLIKSNEVKAPYLGVIENLNLTVRFMGNNIINVKIVDQDNERYEVPFPLGVGIPESPESDAANRAGQFSHSVQDDLFSFKITRKGDNFVIFDSSNGAFVFNDQFLQISTQLANKYIYGFGENNHKNLLHDLDKYTSWGMFARDNAPGWGDNRNNYGFQPVYMGLEPESGKSHIVLLYNSNAMECLFTPSKSLTLRTIGGVLDFYFVLGDSPDDAIQHYHNLIGKPFFPPYWSLGFQISRWGYNKLDDVKAVVQRTREAKIPQDVQYIDIEYMIGYRILTINQLNFSGLSDFQKELDKDGIKLVLIQDPGVVMEKNNSIYMNGKFQDIYIKWPAGLEPYDKDQLNTGDMISWCWPNAKIVYPDYMNGATHWWWRDEIAQFVSNTDGNGTDVAGLWIDMNEPSSFETNERKPWNWLYPENDQDRYPYFTLKCPTNKYDDPPYRTKGAFVFDDDNLLAENKRARLSQKTLCMIAEHTYNGKKYYHYDVHNLYGHTQAIATFNALENIKQDKRPFSLTRSNFVGTGTYAAHWLGDNDSTWEHMKMSIVGSIEYNIFGMTMIGADICGFFRNVSDAEMCTRWIQLGAFSTFSRNHNANQNVDKDPAYFNDTTLTKSTRDVLKIRYELLPHMYTLLYHAHINGGSVMKALFFEFSKDNETYHIDDQLLLGKSLLISPVLQPKQTKVRAYLPPSAIWYDFRTGAKVEKLGWVDLNAPLDYINVHLRGGAILPTQELNDCLNTECSRKNKLGLIVSLDEASKAEGSLFWDDGFKPLRNELHSVLKFAFENNKLTIKAEKDKYKDIGEIKTIKIYGLKGPIKSVHLDGVALNPVKIENDSDPVIITTDISLKSIPSTGRVIEFKA